jgi:hypothetical protein
LVILRQAGQPVEWNKPFGLSGGRLTWRPVVPHPERPIQVSALALVTCDQGHECRVSERVHQIASDGTLSPSYVCGGTNCVFHEFVRLEGWSPADSGNQTPTMGS